MRYLNKHGEETLKNLIDNLKNITEHQIPFKVMVVGLGPLNFYSYDELYAYIHAYERLLKADKEDGDKKWP